jgi:hypothetical protein
MVGYSVIEAALVNKLVAHFSAELSASRCKAGDPDSVFTALFSEGADYGCFLEFNGGREDSQRPFDKPVWVWSLAGVLVIRYGDDIESKLRALVDKLAGIFVHDHTLGGVTPRIRLVDIGDAEPGQVNDTPFYWLPFIAEAIDR